MLIVTRVYEPYVRRVRTVYRGRLVNADKMLSRYVVSQVKHNSYFLVGLALGLWVSLTLIPLDEPPAAACSAALGAAPASDDYEPQREERPLGAAGHTAGRSVQRPRYYSTELGMRGQSIQILYLFIHFESLTPFNGWSCHVEKSNAIIVLNKPVLIKKSIYESVVNSTSF